ncbi:MAG: hypothetical protein GWN87_27585, partial [Desulfuromonadales bacterium]|nr:hypothetical protein [Desulfuromonadales bacterium]
LALFLALRSPIWRWLNLATAAAGTVAVMLSFARSSAVAFGIAIAWLILKYRKNRYFPVMIAGALLIGFMAAPFVPDDYYDRLESIGDIDSDRSVQRR